MSRVYAIALAGGSGKRLWPLSRHALPKQLIPFGGSSLLQSTLDRVCDVSEITDRAVITTHEYAVHIHKAVSALPYAVDLFVEPMAKNSAPAILLTCLEIAKKDPDAQVVFIPSDQVIGNVAEYKQSLRKALQHVRQHPNSIALLGVQPSGAATGYGYISYTQEASPENRTIPDVYPIRAFHEKPTRDKALEYSMMPCTLWNCGIFCGYARYIIELFEKHAPALFHAVTSGDYASIIPVSFDKAIMEHVTQEAVVVHSHFSWADVGTLELFIDHVQTMNSAHQSSGRTVMLDTHNARVYAHEKLIVLYGIRDVCVVETEDAIVIVGNENVASMDRVVDLLHKKGYTQYL